MISYNISYLSEVCPHCGACLWDEWGLDAEDYYGEVSYDILRLLGE